MKQSFTGFKQILKRTVNETINEHMNKLEIDKTHVKLLLSITKQTNETPNNKRRKWNNSDNEDEQEIHSKLTWELRHSSCLVRESLFPRTKPHSKNPLSVSFSPYAKPLPPTSTSLAISLTKTPSAPSFLPPSKLSFPSLYNQPRKKIKSSCPPSYRMHSLRYPFPQASYHRPAL